MSGQLQLHRIHPQNILLTGNSPVLQQNHVILNQSTNADQSTVVLDPPQTVTTTRHSSNQQDVIALVNPDSSRLQMVYSPGGGAVIYAPQGASLKRNDSTQISTGDVVSLQHTPVIQTSTITQENENG